MAVLCYGSRIALLLNFIPFFRAHCNNLICHNYKWLFKNPAALISATRNFGRLECVGKLSSLHQMVDFILQMNLYMRWFPNFSCILKYFSLQSPNIRLQNLNMVHCLSLSKLVLQLGPTHPLSSDVLYGWSLSLQYGPLRGSVWYITIFYREESTRGQSFAIQPRVFWSYQHHSIPQWWWVSQGQWSWLRWRQPCHRGGGGQGRQRCPPIDFGATPASSLHIRVSSFS